VNFEGMFWIVTNGRYQIVNKHALNNYQYIVLTLGTTTSVVNITEEGIVMKEELNPVSHDLKFSLSMVESLFINLCDSFDEDNPSLLDVVILLCMNS